MDVNFFSSKSWEIEKSIVSFKKQIKNKPN